MGEGSISAFLAGAEVLQLIPDEAVHLFRHSCLHYQGSILGVGCYFAAIYDQCTEHSSAMASITVTERVQTAQKQSCT